MDGVAELLAVRRGPIERRTPLARSNLPRPARALPVAGTKQRQRAPRRDTGPDAATRALVTARAGGKCEACGQHGPLQQHHRRPRGMGSSRRPDTNSASNLLALCHLCHLVTEKHRTLALYKGMLLRQGQDPASEPVELLGPTWYYLTPTGEKRRA